VARSVFGASAGPRSDSSPSPPLAQQAEGEEYSMRREIVGTNVQYYFNGAPVE